MTDLTHEQIEDEVHAVPAETDPFQLAATVQAPATTEATSSPVQPLAPLEQEFAQRPWWLREGPPKKLKQKWPGGARSASWIKKLYECAKAHSFKYRDRLPDPAGLDAQVGTAVHGAYEDAGRRRMQQHRGGFPPTVASVEELLHLLEYQPIVVEGNGVEVLKRAREIIQDAGPVDFSGVWDVEHLWRIQATPSLMLAGYIDLIQLRTAPNDLRQVHEVIVTDYKTGPGQVPTVEDLLTDVQAGLYLVWAKRMWPYARVRFRLWNVAQGEEVWIDWSPTIEALVLASARTAQHMWEQQVQTANVGSHCDRCPYRTHCKDFETWLQRQKTKPPELLAGKSLDDVVRIYYESRVLCDLADARRKDAGALILKQMPYDVKSIKACGGRFLAMRKSKRMPYFRSVGDTLRELAALTNVDLRMLLDAVADIGSGRLKSWIKTLPEGLRQQAEGLIQQHQTLNQTPPWVEVHEKEVIF